ncbi:MAG: hypothetical protein FWD48_06335 [Oscillospiraceae bacterium]|nr:hypothetical protein [Oscillospiraceae bacterium]
MQIISLGNIDEDIILWKYSDTTVKNICKIIVPLGFEAITKNSYGDIETIFEDSEKISKKLVDVRYARMQIKNIDTWGVGAIPLQPNESNKKLNFGVHGDWGFSVRNSKVLLEKTAGIGDNVKISDIVELIRPYLNQIVKNVFSSYISEKDIILMDGIMSEEKKLYLLQ